MAMMAMKDRPNETPLGFAYRACKFTTTSDTDMRRACFRVRKILEGVVYDIVALEDNPFTLPEVKTLIEGITVGGHKVSDAEQVLNQANSWRELLRQVDTGTFVMSAGNFKSLHSLVAREEALIWGAFRTGHVGIAGTEHQPPEHTELDMIFENGMNALMSIESVHERAFATFLFGALNQFFYDGNKRTSRLLMNGQLLSAGYDAVSIPATRKTDFNREMIDFYDTRDAGRMFRFLTECSLDQNLRCIPVESQDSNRRSDPPAEAPGRR